jgi:hypothetical protein
MGAVHAVLSLLDFSARESSLACRIVCSAKLHCLCMAWVQRTQCYQCCTPWLGAVPWHVALCASLFCIACARHGRSGRSAISAGLRGLGQFLGMSHCVPHESAFPVHAVDALLDFVAWGSSFARCTNSLRYLKCRPSESGRPALHAVLLVKPALPSKETSYQQLCKSLGKVDSYICLIPMQRGLFEVGRGQVSFDDILPCMVDTLSGVGWPPAGNESA